MRSFRSALIFGVMVAMIGQASAQDPRFEVATIKRNTTPPDHAWLVPGIHDSAFRAEFSSLKELLAAAYHVDLTLITGPAWLGSDRFDISAKLPDGAAEMQWPAMLQALLTERFQLVLRRDAKEMDVFAMVPAKSGLKLPSPKPVVLAGKGVMVDGRSMSQLAEGLSLFAGRPVLDDTGVPDGTYYFLTFTPKALGPDDLDLGTALQEQLGIKLESRKVNMGTIVVEKGERVPTEN